MSKLHQEIDEMEANLHTAIGAQDVNKFGEAMQAILQHLSQANDVAANTLRQDIQPIRVALELFKQLNEGQLSEADQGAYHATSNSLTQIEKQLDGVVVFIQDKQTEMFRMMDLPASFTTSGGAVKE